MSLPSSAVNSISRSRCQSSFQAMFAATSTAAASLDAPPSPAADGIRLMSRIFAPILRESLVGRKKQEVQVFSRQIRAFEHETYLETV